MNIEDFRAVCLSKKGVTEEFPFDENTLTFKVVGRIFAIADVDRFESINLKCDPEQSMELQELHDAVKPGYHMNKKHWITVSMDNSIPQSEILQWIENSYQLVVNGLTKSQKSILQSL
ncbi:MAG: MmcQ/YjbR family DNA-binding protein [Flammeovirgaceae bacterium]|nr:MmcQ/YjbR family DNA-binding protein [Flammeovirgaceae bacterium]